MILSLIWNAHLLLRDILEEKKYNDSNKSSVGMFVRY